MAENVDMSRKDSFIWTGLYCLIWGVYLLSRCLDPAPGEDVAALDFILTLSATSLLVPLVLLIKRRARREREKSFYHAWFPGNKLGNWYEGDGAPAPGLGIAGDVYLNVPTSDVYQKTGGGWVSLRMPGSGDRPPTRFYR